MQVGIYCSSNKPHLWDSLYQTLSQNNVDFNLCIAGPYPPIDELPGNVKYIQTNVKPAQCFFIAANNVKGDYITPMSDDIIFSPGFLDDMVRLIDGKMTIVSPFTACGDFIYKEENHNAIWDARGYTKGDSRATYENRKYCGMMLPLSFHMPWLTFMHRETFNGIGIDKNYIALWWNLDLVMELVSKGGKTIISTTSYGYDFIASKKTICQIPCDIFRFNNMWIDQAVVNGPDKKVRDIRKEPIDPLVYNDTVLTVSQGKIYPPPSSGNIDDPTGKSAATPTWI